MKMALFALALIAAPLSADSDLPPARWANEQLPDPRAETKAAALMEEIRCVVCQGQSIADSNAALAGTMRALVRERIAVGDSPAAVRAFLISRYGAWISYRPPLEPLTWPLYAAPLLMLALGTWLAWQRLRRGSR